jgi:sec-independent protein translocase protein TatB
MLDIGWTELLVIGVVALIVIGPRDLPMALHTFGKFVGKLRGMARDFQHGIDEIARQQELREIQQGINKFRSPEEAIENYVQGLESKGRKPAASDEAEAEADEAAALPSSAATGTQDGQERKAPAGQTAAAKSAPAKEGSSEPGPAESGSTGAGNDKPGPAASS